MVRLSIITSAFALLIASTVLPVRADDESIDIRSRQITHFKVGSDQTRFGEFEFMGGLELSSSSASLGGMSAIRLSEGRDNFLGVMDTGFWYAGRFERDEDGVLTGVTDFSVSPILDADGAASDEKWRFDAEGLVVRGDEVLVSFERDSRVDIYPAKAPGGSRPTGSLPLLIPLEEFRSNRGLETITVAPETSALAGAVVVVSERSLNTSGDIYAAILTGPSKGVFFVKRHAPYDITDGDFLPNGDLLLLERRFSMAEGIGMRIRRIDGSRLGPGNLVDGPVLLETDFGYQIDNMEGLDVTTDNQGQIFVTLVSDDNHSILQRNLILEFRYLGDAQ
ncbi:MAG: esterase-like activity of phytase family protein [Hoeflea sp.]|nr:esterase-like activity of phytase family protein [Alphaproteobacteria bacterium]MBV1726233.1 esterase-like activity of phytase family protein [Hoeflea sp.]MBU4545565.1 esterase-like activity of phytase family protein [Alphaproteobacteria bacterium]MBU4552175.1 esterase-like activity of phytase family protein [Alphaproteobacteria bacterium]MBV1762340.1 esterase-like activity of phytase family protein [Hoeflea sp.]